MGRNDVMTSYLEAVAVACLTAFAFAVWAPLALAVVGVFALLASWALTPRKGRG